MPDDDIFSRLAERGFDKDELRQAHEAKVEMFAAAKRQCASSLRCLLSGVPAFLCSVFCALVALHGPLQDLRFACWAMAAFCQACNGTLYLMDYLAVRRVVIEVRALKDNDALCSLDLLYSIRRSRKLIVETIPWQRSLGVGSAVFSAAGIILTLANIAAHTLGR